MRYGTGTMRLVENDLKSNGFAIPWGHKRSYSNRASSAAYGVNGAGWFVRQMAYLIFRTVEEQPRIIIQFEAGAALRFKSDGNGNWTAAFASQAKLVHKSESAEYILVRKDGTRWVFFDNSTGVPGVLRGQLKSMVDSFGHVNLAEYDAFGRLVGMKFQSEDGIESSAYEYRYLDAGPNLGLLYSVILRVNARPVREAQYRYYTDESDGGSTGDLERVDIGEYDAVLDRWNLVRQTYYRYYQAGDPDGFAHGLKYVVSPEGYARMRRVGLDPATASDSLLESYSSHFFKYHGDRRVAEERIRGGSEAFVYDYFENPASPSVSAWNTWAVQTTETLPDGNRKVVYTNAAGMVILIKRVELATGREWFTYRQYNTTGLPTVAARPSAIQSVSEPVEGLSDNLSVTLKTHEGLVYENVYYTEDNPSVGAVAHYQKELLARKGGAGDNVTLRESTFATQLVESVAIHPFATKTTFLREGVPSTTSYARAYFGEDGQPAVLALPAVASFPVNSVADDIVIEQHETLYDEAGQVIASARFQRFHDATGTGPLGGPNGNPPKGRRTYSATWFDPIGRVVADADYGTNGGAILDRPERVPERSDTVLVTTRRYGRDEESGSTIDPMGTVTRWKNDAVGRRLWLAEAATEPGCACGGAGKGSFGCGPAKGSLDGCGGGERVSSYTYTADGQIATLTLVNDDTGNQVTRWVYGTTLEDSGVARNDLLRAKIYPMSDDSHAPLGDGWDSTYQRTEYGYNRQGDIVTKKDPNETVHEYAYDKLGRQIEDAATALGSGIDEAVRRITTTYEVRGMVATVTSHDALSGGSVLNEVAYAYDDFGQLIEDAQDHGGEVDGSTPKVLYGYADGSTGNTARRTSMTYPDGRVINILYGPTEGLDNHLSRITALKVVGEGQNLVTYSYVGEARYVKIAYPEPGIELSYIKSSGEPERDSGDPYTGYDRFGRTVDMKWQTPGGTTMLDRVQYGYDRGGNRTWRRDLAAPAGHDEFFRYDALYQVTDLFRGNLNLNQTAIGGIPVFEENFDYDPTGNWNRYRSAADGTETFDQTRVNNRDNQITQHDGSNEGILYDRAGQALQMPPDVEGDWAQYYRLVWDAWARLVEVKDGSLATVATYAYDGTTRRISKTVGGTTIHTYYNDRWKAIEEREGSSTDASRQYLWGARPNHRDELVRQDRDTTGGGTLDERLYCLMDYYDPIAMTDATGDVVERYEFSAFGLRSVMDGEWARLSATAHAVEFAFHGQFLDPETGYYDYGYRYYSPQIGRWLSRDPIGESGGMNLYCAIKNNPKNSHDYRGAVALSNEDDKCTEEEMNQLQGVFSSAHHYYQQAANSLPIYNPETQQIISDDELKSYTKWFGDYSELRLTKVRDVVLLAVTFFNSEIEVNCCEDEQYCTEHRNASAYVLPDAYLGGKVSVNLCGRYWSSPNPVRVIIHELAHEAGAVLPGGQEEIYGVNDVISLAKNSPGLAVLNAESYSYFIINS